MDGETHQSNERKFSRKKAQVFALKSLLEGHSGLMKENRMVPVDLSCYNCKTNKQQSWILSGGTGEFIA